MSERSFVRKLCARWIWQRTDDTRHEQWFCRRPANHLGDCEFRHDRTA